MPRSDERRNHPAVEVRPGRHAVREQDRLLGSLLTEVIVRDAHLQTVERTREVLRLIVPQRQVVEADVRCTQHRHRRWRRLCLLGCPTRTWATANVFI